MGNTLTQSAKAFIMFPLNVQEAAAYDRYGSCIAEHGRLF